MSSRPRFLLTDEMIEYVRRDAEACAERDPRMSRSEKVMHILTLSKQGMPWAGRNHWYEAYDNKSESILWDRYVHES